MGNPKKFLTAYGAITGVGAAALGYMALTSASARSEAEADYAQKLGKVTTLQKGKVYPNQAGVDAKAAQVKAMSDSAEKLVAAIKAFQLPDDPAATSATVQAKLNKYITDATAAASKEWKLPENFDFGFARFRNSLGTEIAGKVDIWVEGANALLALLKACNVEEIISLTAPEMPWEKQAAPAATGNAAPPNSKPKPPPAASGAVAKKQTAPTGNTLNEASVLERYPLQVTFNGKTNSVAAVIQALSNSGVDAPGKFFYAVRHVRIESENKLGPDKQKEVKIEDKKDGDYEYQVDAVYVLGGENIRAYVDLDIIRVLDAPAAAADKPKN